MSSLSPIPTIPAIKFEYLNWIAVDPLPRDHTRSHRLHEPEHHINTIDPMTGNDIDNVTSHTSLVDGNLNMYFETDGTRKAYLDMPLDHPNRTCLTRPQTVMTVAAETPGEQPFASVPIESPDTQKSPATCS